MKLLLNALLGAFVMFLAGFSVVCKVDEVSARIQAHNYKQGMLRCEQLIDHANRIMTRRQQWQFHAVIVSAAKERQ